MNFRYYRWNVRCGKVIEESTAELDTYVAELVAVAPPLTVQQMAKLRPILSTPPPPSRAAATLVMAGPSGGAGRGTGRR